MTDCRQIEFAFQDLHRRRKLVALLRIGAVDAGAAGVRKTAYPQAPC
jgi:hypothetical protein